MNPLRRRGGGIPRFGGELIAPGSRHYDQARRVWNSAVDRYPALIARARDTADVVAVVRYAREQGLALSVRGGGHSAAGLAVADGALMLDFSAMKTVQVDAKARVMLAGPGATWDGVDAATQVYGLATTGATVGTVGVAGMTLGGGVGRLDRLAGLACDNLIDAEVVTADGRVLTASEHPDLLWALRGGGGNFGVVTLFRHRLHPVGPAHVLLLGYPFADAADVLRAYVAFSAQAPDRLALYAGLQIAPAQPFIPENLRGRRFAALFALWFGAADEGPERIFAPLRALLPPPAMDVTSVMSYLETQRLAAGMAPVGLHRYETIEWLSRLDEATIDALVNAAAAAPTAWSTIAVKRMGGAAARVPATGTAFWHRQAAHEVHVQAEWAPGEPADVHRDWVRSTRAGVSPASTGGGYVNFVNEDGGPGRIRAAYGGNYERLARVKAVYDPDNFFHLNHNIAPAGQPKLVHGGSAAP